MSEKAKELSRGEWIAQAESYLTRVFNQKDSAKYAETLAVDYYDEFPNDYSPEDAVREDASYA